MQWIRSKDKLPPGDLVVLGWGRNYDSDLFGFHLCGMDYKQGWLTWPALDHYLEITYWALIEGPNSEIEQLYVELQEELKND